MLSAKSVTHYNYLSRANEYVICPYHIENKEKHIYILAILNGP